MVSQDDGDLFFVGRIAVEVTCYVPGVGWTCLFLKPCLCIACQIGCHVQIPHFAEACVNEQGCQCTGAGGGGGGAWEI